MDECDIVFVFFMLFIGDYDGMYFVFEYFCIWDMCFYLFFFWCGVCGLIWFLSIIFIFIGDWLYVLFWFCLFFVLYSCFLWWGGMGWDGMLEGRLEFMCSWVCCFSEVWLGEKGNFWCLVLCKIGVRELDLVRVRFSYEWMMGIYCVFCVCFWNFIFCVIFCFVYDILCWLVFGRNYVICYVFCLWFRLICCVVCWIF